MCSVCNEHPRLSMKTRLCKQCDEQRRATLYGYCQCGRAIFARGMCATCYSRDLRYRSALRNSYIGNYEDEFLTMIDGMVNRLATAFGHAYQKWDAYIDHAAYADDPDVAEIATLLAVAADLKDEQYRNILRRVNRRLDGVCRLIIPQSRRSEYATSITSLPSREHSEDYRTIGAHLATP